MIIFKYFIFAMTLNVLSLAPERKDMPDEFSLSSFTCNYRESYSDDFITSISDDAKKGDSIASYYLFFGARMMNNKVNHFAELLQLMINNGNPAGLMVKGTLLFDEDKFKEGLFFYERAAELGMISAISNMHEIYNGEKYPDLQNKALELYWWKREAISGNIYSLKKYIISNPEKLSKHELSHWQKAYEIMINKENFNIYKREVSNETKLILYQVNENRERLEKTLIKHHPWYAHYKGCRK